MGTGASAVFTHPYGGTSARDACQSRHQRYNSNAVHAQPIIGRARRAILIAIRRKMAGGTPGGLSGRNPRPGTLSFAGSGTRGLMLSFAGVKRGALTGDCRGARWIAPEYLLDMCSVHPIKSCLSLTFLTYLFLFKIHTSSLSSLFGGAILVTLRFARFRYRRRLRASLPFHHTDQTRELAR